MCLLIFSYKQSPDYKLILAANRDEFYRRSAEPAHYWSENSNIFAGRDIQGGGTWLGVNKQGAIAALTNYRDIRSIKANAPTRGKLVSDYLTGKYTGVSFTEFLNKSGKNYNGFNLIFGSTESLNYFNNVNNRPEVLAPGIYNLSNHLLNSPWPKSRKINKMFGEVIAGQFTPGDLFQILTDNEAFQEDLPDTGLSPEIERAISSIFIVTPEYGTRCSTVILIDQDDNLFFEERSFDNEGNQSGTVKVEFKVSAPI